MATSRNDDMSNETEALRLAKNMTGTTNIRVPLDITNDGQRSALSVISGNIKPAKSTSVNKQGFAKSGTVKTISQPENRKFTIPAKGSKPHFSIFSDVETKNVEDAANSLSAPKISRLVTTQKGIDKKQIPELSHQASCSSHVILDSGERGGNDGEELSKAAKGYKSQIWGDLPDEADELSHQASCSSNTMLDSGEKGDKDREELSKAAIGYECNFCGDLPDEAVGTGHYQDPDWSWDESDEEVSPEQVWSDKPDPEQILYRSPFSQKEVYIYLRELEKKFQPQPRYMYKQQDINSSMRTILVDWLIDVVESYKLDTQTLYLAVRYTDRFLSTMSVLRGKLQLVGTTNLFIACKYEEVMPPDLDEFVFITADTYDKKQILRMEGLILNALDFNLSAPTAYEFLRRFSCLCNTPQKISYLAMFICELSLLEVEPFLHYLPSKIAAASLCLANYTVGLALWEDLHVEVTGYKLADLKTCILSLQDFYLNLPNYPHRAVTEKYKNTRYHWVADIEPCPIQLK